MTETQEVKIDKFDGKGALWTLAGTAIGGLATQWLRGAHGGYGGFGGYGTAPAAQIADAAGAAMVLDIARKDAEIAQLRADRETDGKLVEVYKDLRRIDKEQDGKLDALHARVAAIETAAPLREEIVNGRIAEVATLAKNGVNALHARVSELGATVSAITRIHVPITAVCPEPMPAKNSWTAPEA